jgi:5'-deoxynucleotidase YfbR-like HD superfamily hydrolase
MAEEYIKQDITALIKNADILRCLKRYNNYFHITNESVAEHSFFVALYVLKLHDYYRFDLEKALVLSLTHDFPEIEISDVPHDIKAKMPKLNSALSDAESLVADEKLSPAASKMLDEFNDLSSAEGLIASLADILDVISYSRIELNMGNKYMNYIALRSSSRYECIVEKLDKYLNPECKYTTAEMKTIFDNIINIY